MLDQLALLESIRQDGSGGMELDAEGEDTLHDEAGARTWGCAIVPAAVKLGPVRPSWCSGYGRGVGGVVHCIQQRGTGGLCIVLLGICSRVPMAWVTCSCHVGNGASFYYGMAPGGD
jgi:hypothetical protein